MNYVILNGKRSTDVRGLLIQSLPPISKPLIRTQVEEIDGRDGDIITKLGYSAYDRQITIGLHGIYNVDDVISFFDSAGTVVFSNEPDKYYNYQITAQIDFERLIRFRTATVVFHVQPFKFSAVDRVFTLENDLLALPDYTEEINGITLEASGDEITISGTATEETEIYIPVDVRLKADAYTLEIDSYGSNPSACAVRLIHDAPDSARTFGGQAITLSNGAVSIGAEIEEPTEYNYLYFKIKSALAISLQLKLTLGVTDFGSGIQLYNRGNTVSKPQVTLAGSGTITLFVNGVQAFVISLGDDDMITIDPAQMDAYTGGTLRNRSVSGDYDNLTLKPGRNTISWSGTVERIEVENFSRWM